MRFLLNRHFIKQSFTTIKAEDAREVTEDSIVAPCSGDQTAPDQPQGAHASNGIFLLHMQELYFINGSLVNSHESMPALQTLQLTSSSR